jgi:hypothetical protein
VKKRLYSLSTRGTTGAREISGELRGEMITGFPQWRIVLLPAEGDNLKRGLNVIRLSAT